MFDFVRFVAKLFMRLSETTPPNIAGTPSLLAAIRGPKLCRTSAHVMTGARPTSLKGEEAPDNSWVEERFRASGVANECLSG